MRRGIHVREAPAPRAVLLRLRLLLWGRERLEAESSVAARLRKKMLGENFESEYSCCQMEAVGFAPCCANQCACFKDCPTLGLCLEACCCSALSVSFSRIYAMHRYNVRPDPWDWKCIEFSNCMQCLSCAPHTPLGLRSAAFIC